MTPENFHLPLKALGYDGVWDYKSSDFGVQATVHGLLVVEGNLYGPCIPRHLVDATSRYRAGEVDEHEYAELIEQRRAYRARVKTESDGRTSATFRCPGAGSHRAVKCDLKPVSARQENQEIEHRKTLPLIVTPPVDPPRCCTNSESVSIPPDFAVRYLQKQHFGSPEWKRYYSHPRNSIEGKNNYLKAADLIDIGEAGKRRFRGFGKHLIAFALMTVAANVHTIMNWLEERYAHENDAPTKIGRPPMTGLEKYLPDIDTPLRIVGAGGQVTRAG